MPKGTRRLALRVQTGASDSTQNTRPLDKNKERKKARDCRKVKMRLHEEVEKKDTGISLLVSMNRYIHTLWSVCHCHCHSLFLRSLSLTSIDRDGRIILLLTLTESNGIKALKSKLDKTNNAVIQGEMGVKEERKGLILHGATEGYYGRC